jgi:hypothetical protein
MEVKNEIKEPLDEWGSFNMTRLEWIVPLQNLNRGI